MDAVPANILQPFFVTANSFTLDESLENLVELARTSDGRSDLASKNMLTTTLQLCQSLSYPSSGGTLLLALKLVRNLCAGELRNQNSFIERNGVDIVSDIISSKELVNDSNYGVIRMGLQVLANVSLAGEEHLIVIWNRIYSLEFVEIAKVRRKEICDPLCMIIYACIEENHKLLDQLCSDHALPLLVEIIRTALAVGFGEDWMKLILTKTCIEESYFIPLFSKLRHENSDGLPTSSSDINALGYSLCILRDICAFDGHMDIVDSLLSQGLIQMLLDLLRDLEPPTVIRKTLKNAENQDSTTYSGKLCPYKGFRGDIVAVIGNYAYKRKHVQDEIRDKNGILLMLQQCVTDDENPFLREWGIWSVRNLLEGNLENQKSGCGSADSAGKACKHHRLKILIRCDWSQNFCVTEEVASTCFKMARTLNLLRPIFISFECSYDQFISENLTCSVVPS
ncbi:hypothetical protein L1987_28579 [Smallanthus sonchifolius]|uniref:Uncharacterized protein n=1 Tax=Smallanthus sonchifolius TaxID=185202 RepID=A0ACB9HYF3_9ASTR|nr:hypothetical protein L1987_28579 [Smallanthus sonchifolius]